MGVEVNGEIRESLGGPVGGVRILRPDGSGVEWKIIAHNGEVFTGRYTPPSSSGFCEEIIDFPGQIPDTLTLEGRYGEFLGAGFTHSLLRDGETLRPMQHIPISSNGNGSERWVTRVRRSVLCPAGLFHNSPI